MGIAWAPLGDGLIKSACMALAREQLQTDLWNPQPPANVPRRFLFSGGHLAAPIQPGVARWFAQGVGTAQPRGTGKPPAR
jgi:hypothetical protein